MKNPFAKLIILFLLHTGIQSILLGIFYLLIMLCFEPVGFIFTVSGYLLNIVGALVLASVSAMIIAFYIKRNKLGANYFIWMIPVFNLPVFFALMYIFNKGIEYSLLMYCGGMLFAYLFAWIGFRSLARKA